MAAHVLNTSKRFGAPPIELIALGGIEFGVFDDVPSVADLRDYRTGFSSRLRFKSWHHLLIHSSSLSMTVAMVDLGYLKTAWVRWIPADGESLEWSRKSPLSACVVQTRLRGTVSSFRARRFDLELAHHTPRHHELRFNSPEFSIELDLDGRAVSPLAVCLPIGAHHALYSQKMPLACAGAIRLAGETFDLSDGVAMIDVHQAYYPHRTTWRWATAGWRSEHGALCGFNLTRNQARQPERFNECALWHDGRLYRLPLPEFEVPEQPLAPWRVASEDGAVELAFEPQGLRQDNTRIGPLVSQYQQPWGRFRGRITVPELGAVAVDAFGVCEDHLAAW